MQFKLHSLIDITQTNSRRNEDPKGWRQQQNFSVVFGALGLRVNPYYDNPPTLENTNIKDLGFGSKYKGKQNVWTFDFYIEYEDGLDLDMLEEDLDLIPIIVGLDETIDIYPEAIYTRDTDLKNIVFKCVHKN